MAAKKAKRKSDDVGELIERILSTRSVLNLQLDDVGIMIGNRKFSFTGKLTIGPVDLGKRIKG